MNSILRVSVLCVGLLALTLAVFFNLTPLKRVGFWWGYLIRMAGALAFLLIIRSHTRSWSRMFRRAVQCDEDARLGVNGDQSFQKLTGDDLINIWKRLAPGVVQNRWRLADEVVNVAHRRRVDEEIVFSSGTMRRRVVVTFSTPVPEGELFVVARPLSGRRYDDFILEGESGQTISLKSHLETRVILFHLIICAVVRMTGVTPSRESLHDLATHLVAQDGSAGDAFLSLMGFNPDAKSLSGPQSGLHNLLKIALGYRVILGEAKVAELNGIVFNYIESHQRGTMKTQEAPLSWWHKKKSKVYTLFHQTPDWIIASASRAVTSPNYSLTVRAPERAFIQEIVAIDGPREGKVAECLPNLPRRVLHKSFVNYRIGPEAVSAVFSAGSLHQAGIRQPRVLLRLREIPPGHNGFAAIVATMATLVIWITGVSFPLGGSQSVDMIAFALAVPGFAVGVHRLRAPELSQWASLTSRISLTISMSLSLASAALYLGFDSGKIPKT